MEFKIDTGSKLDPKEEKNHIIFSNRLQRNRDDVEFFIKEWRNRDAPNLFINAVPKLDLCVIRNVHTDSAKIILLSTKLQIPRVEIVIPMNSNPKLNFLMNVGDSFLPIHDQITGKEFGYELVDSQITHYMWIQVNNYFKKGVIEVHTELLHSDK